MDTLRLPPTSREALVAKRGLPPPYDYVLRVLSAANNPLDVIQTPTCRPYTIRDNEHLAPASSNQALF